MIQHLKKKFNDQENLIDQFLLPGNVLKKLEDGIPVEIKKRFVNGFLDKLVAEGILTPEQRTHAPETNPWSVDFPSWHGPFDPSRGKRFVVIGSEPHIHFSYLQSVYQLNGETTTDSPHEMLKFLHEILSFNGESFEEILDELYLTDLLPFAPMRGNRTAMGSPEKLEAFLTSVGSWSALRREYATRHLAEEIAAVKPQLVIAQGKAVFDQIIRFLHIEAPVKSCRIASTVGNAHNVRCVDWQTFKIVSLPHIGTRQHKGFYRRHAADARSGLAQLVKT